MSVPVLFFVSVCIAVYICIDIYLYRCPSLSMSMSVYLRLSFLRVYWWCDRVCCSSGQQRRPWRLTQLRTAATYISSRLVQIRKTNSYTTSKTPHKDKALKNKQNAKNPVAAAKLHCRQALAKASVRVRVQWLRDAGGAEGQIGRPCRRQF